MMKFASLPGAPHPARWVRDVPTPHLVRGAGDMRCRFGLHRFLTATTVMLLLRMPKRPIG